MSLGIVLINYNSEEELFNYISSELTQIQTKNIIVVVNNSYSNQSHNKLEEKLKQIESRDFDKDLFLISKKENLGYARANNFGAQFLNMKFAIKYFLFSNTDLKFKDQDVVDILIQKVNDIPEKFAAIGPRVLGLDNIDQSPKEKISFCRYFFWHLLPFLRGKFKLLRNRKENFTINETISAQCYQLSGCFFIIKSTDFLKSGMFDENTFLYGEEKILSERLKKIDRFMYFHPEVAIIHFESTVVNSNFNSSYVNKLQHINNCYYYQNYRNAPKILVSLLKFLK